MNRLPNLYKEISSIDAELRELNGNLEILKTIENMPLEVCKIEGFSGKLRAKVDNTFQCQVEKLEEKKLELDEILRSLIMLTGEEPKSATFSDDLQRVVEYCLKLKDYLCTAYSFTSTLPVLDLMSENAISRLSTDISIANKALI